MSYLAAMTPTGHLDLEAARNLGKDLTAAYVGAEPFPHIVIDDFLPAEVVEMCLAHFPTELPAGAVTYDRAQERLKTQYLPETLDEEVRTLFYGFNALPFIKLLENITGIKGLIPDPYFMGAGFHEIRNGGHLSVHADFNHHKPMNLERRINVLIYLNKDWRDAYGGQLELWDDAMETCVRSVVPECNRCVIFSTTSRSWHGNPQPVAHPGGVSRKSIALYYYTATWTDDRREHTTQFQVRKGSQDKVDWQTKARELADVVKRPVKALITRRT
jgi:hypothetical protein